MTWNSGGEIQGHEIEWINDLKGHDMAWNQIILNEAIWRDMIREWNDMKWHEIKQWHEWVNEWNEMTWHGTTWHEHEINWN